jgi:hypothetical protein
MTARSEPAINLPVRAASSRLRHPANRLYEQDKKMGRPQARMKSTPQFQTKLLNRETRVDYYRVSSAAPNGT